jgi:hypothetical protein
VASRLADGFLAAPWLAALVWLLLQGADWALTIRGAAMRRRLFELAGVEQRSAYELNPIFRDAVSRNRPLSARFLATWIGGAAFVYAFCLYFAMLGQWSPGWARSGLGLAFGAIVFTRSALIVQHLRNMQVFGHALRLPHPEEFARVQFDLATNLRISASSMAGVGALLGLATILTDDPWLFGGALGVTLIALKHAFLARRAARSARPASP